ncbi:MAG: PEP-CTERM sorting domain-containing protein [Microcystaceae cyanobacterium]
MESIAIWGVADVSGVSLANFSLEASSTSDFSSPIALGSFTASQPTANPTLNNGVFTFAQTNAQFFRLNTETNYGFNVLGFGEIIFEEVPATQSTPEPSSLLGLFLIGGAGFLAKKRQK